MSFFTTGSAGQPRRWILTALGFLAGIGVAAPCAGQHDLAKLLASDGAEDDRFGCSVSVSGDVAVVGAYYHDENGEDSGSAYVYRYDGLDWVEEAELLASDGESDDWFGYSVAVSGDVAVIGACQDDCPGFRSGSAYVYRFDGESWHQEARLSASDGAPADYFGLSVAISGDVVVIGAIWNDDNGDDAGAAYVYRYDGSGWTKEAKLLATYGAAGDEFGCAVSVCDDVAVIGAHHHAAIGCANVYRFDGRNWIEEGTLRALDAGEGDEFGHSVSISGDVALIGAHGDDDNGAQSGSSYVFAFDGDAWVEEAKLRASDGAQDDCFGHSVSISGDLALIGAHGDDDNGSRSGSSYVFAFDGDTWAEKVKVRASDAAEGDALGGAVSVSGDVAVIGATQDDDNGDASGSAYIFAPSGTFVGPPGGSWFDPSNWSGGTVPDSETFVLIPGYTVIGQPGAAARSVLIKPQAGLIFDPDSNLATTDGLTVSDGALLHGDGSIVGRVFNNGTLAVSSGLGTLQIAGDYIQSVDGECRIEVGEQQQHDLLDVSGHQAILDGTLTVQTVGPYHGSVDDSFDVLLAADISGEFSTVDVSGHDDCLIMAVRFQPDRVRLEFQPVMLDPVEISKLLSSHGDLGDDFGSAVSVSGDVAVIGAYSGGNDGLQTGSATVYRYDGPTWIEEARLLASDGAYQDRFGWSVAISGDIAVIGAVRDDDNGDMSGSAYVFRYDGQSWIEEAKLLPSDGAEDDRFGCSVSVSGDVAVVGAHRHDNYSGAAYVYRFDGENWNEEAKLLASDAPLGGHFGCSVSLWNGVVVIGAYGDDENAEDAGAAYVFRFDGQSWLPEAKLLASDGAYGDRLGYAVSVSDDVAVIGAYGDDDNGPSSGSAYVCRHDGETWQEEEKLLAADGGGNLNRFGYSVSISGNVAAIGAYWDWAPDSESGSAHLYRYDGQSWTEQVRFLPADGAEYDWFGHSVSISDDTVVVGAPGDDDNGPESGAAYVFALTPPPDCNENGIADDCDISLGLSDDVNANGIPDECECPADFDDDGDVDTADLLFLLAAWGTPDGDVDGDGDTDTADLLALLAAWGECP
jgi:hypothetical protein